MNQPPAPRRARARGCTLIETLIILTVFSLLMGCVGAIAMARLRDLRRGQRYQTFAVMRQVEVANAMWSVQPRPPRLGHARARACSWASLVQTGELRRIPTDGWRRPLLMVRCDDEGVLLYSRGPDGIAHTRDDLLSWGKVDASWAPPPPPRPRRAGPWLAAVLGLWLLLWARRGLIESPFMAPAAG